MNIIITESQHQTFLLETISTYLRRRMHMDDMKQEMDAIIEYHMIPCEFDNAGDFVESDHQLTEIFNYIDHPHDSQRCNIG